MRGEVKAQITLILRSQPVAGVSKDVSLGNRHRNKRKVYLSKISPICNPFGNLLLTISLTLCLLNQERFCYDYDYAA
jgi:hypothetical protein